MIKHSRRAKCLSALAFLWFLICFSGLYYTSDYESWLESYWTSFWESGPKLPPLYEQYHEYERRLPQHNTSLAPPEGDGAKFVYFGNHVSHVGWGNTLQEMILHAHLAYATKRSFVFTNFTWDHDMTSDYSTFEFGDTTISIPARIPVSTMLSGPIIGGPFDPGSDVPRAVSLEYFREVCPNPTIIRSNSRKHELSTKHAGVLFDAWFDLIESIDDRCIEFSRDQEQLFDIWVFGQKGLTSLWPTLARSPIITKLGVSELTLSNFVSNWKLFHLHRPKALEQTNFMKAEPIPGLLVLHVRRGDFEEHCIERQILSSPYEGWNTIDELPDKLNAGNSLQSADQNEKEEIYRRHCFPTIEEIVRKVSEVRESASVRGERLNRIYVMTNGKRDWVKELTVALQTEAKEPWEKISSSRDVVYTWEQKFVAQNMDIYVAARAQTFIGNGFSSLTANVVMLRMFRTFDPQNTRFW